MKSHMRGANLRRWLNRSDCPGIIRKFKDLFDKAFSHDNPRSCDAPISRRADIAYYAHNGVMFSRCTTHMGNSLVLYYPSDSSSVPIAGSIQKIDASGDQVHFFIQRQAPLPLGRYDPFCRYTSFPATLYSSKMDDVHLDEVPLESIVSHVARFTYSADCAVILNLSRVSLSTSFCLHDITELSGPQRFDHPAIIFY